MQLRQKREWHRKCIFLLQHIGESFSGEKKDEGKIK